MPSVMTIPRFARDLGVTAVAVKKAIQKGRLTAAVLGRREKNGHLYIRDVEGARLEWSENAQGKPPAVENDSAQKLFPMSALAQAAVRERTARATMLEQANARKAGEWVPVKLFEARFAERVKAASIILQGIPTKAKQR